ncbi:MULTISPECIES: LysR family transcriptional regulator [unclassified Aeromicrobium]|uniref:LysR family transcriptional regulator n=1 Tax=unclassified Aeromicrobium TaxID=2633570 RepID=UPI00396B410A
MKLRHVKYFVTIADSGSVSSAATRLHITQPAISRQLRQLEQELGADLFDRNAGRLALSRTGRALLPKARELLAAADLLRAEARFHAYGGVARVTIAAPTVTLTDVIAPFVATMTSDDPVVDVRSADGLSVRTTLEEGADLSISTHRPSHPYTYRELASLPVWAYVPAHDPWAERSSVTLLDLLKRPLVALPTTYTAREALDTAVAKSGNSYDQLLEAGNGTIAQALAASGRGAAVVSDDPRFKLEPLAIATEEGPLAIKLVAAWDERSIAAPYLETLVELLTDWIGARYPGSTSQSSA